MAILNDCARRAALLACLFYALPPMAAVCADDAPLEFAIKAAYVSKLAPFVTWPPSQKPDTAFNLCISGTDEVAKLLPQSVAGQQINGRPIQIRQLPDGGDPQDCQILYIASSPAEAQALNTAHNKPVLTVTEGGGAGHGIVQFTVVQRHVRFDIDEGLAADGGLSISSKLLGLANSVTPGPQVKP